MKFKKKSILLISLIYSNFLFTQSIIYPKEVEEKIIENRMNSLPEFNDILAIYSFESNHLTNIYHAENFDNKLALNDKILSAHTSFNNQTFLSVVTAYGSIKPDEMKLISIENGGNFSNFSLIYALSNNVVIKTNSKKIKNEVWRSELEKAPEHKLKEVLDNPEKYIIIEK